LLVLGGQQHADLPLMLTEFGGIALDRHNGGWGYSRSATPEQFAEQYTKLLEVVRELGILSGFCYTQFADTYQEINGLLYADRTPKIPMRQIASATAGPRADRTDGIEQIEIQAAFNLEGS
jgi:hypothetical protein